jgi:hypothetical protein
MFTPVTFDRIHESQKDRNLEEYEDRSQRPNNNNNEGILESASQCERRRESKEDGQDYARSETVLCITATTV